jgi:hypothetical protein
VYELGTRIAEDEHILHQYLELVDKYTLVSPQLGTFLLSLVTDDVSEEEIMAVRNVSLGEHPASESLTR